MALLILIYKLLEKLIYRRIKYVIDESLPSEFAGFRENRSSVEKILAFTSYIEAGFERQLKTSAIFIDLLSAYDTIWRQGFMLKNF